MSWPKYTWTLQGTKLQISSSSLVNSQDTLPQTPAAASGGNNMLTAALRPLFVICDSRWSLTGDYIYLWGQTVLRLDCYSRGEIKTQTSQVSVDRLGQRRWQESHCSNLKSLVIWRGSATYNCIFAEWPLSGLEYKRASKRRVSTLNPRIKKKLAGNCQGALEEKKKNKPPTEPLQDRGNQCNDCLHCEHLCRWLKNSKPWKKL